MTHQDHVQLIVPTFAETILLILPKADPVAITGLVRVGLNANSIMDRFEELVRMAANATISNSAGAAQNGPSDDTIQRWQRVFLYSYSEAVERINEHRSDLSRPQSTDEHWDMVRTQFERQGFDKEAFEYNLGRSSGRTRDKAPLSTRPEWDQTTYLLKLDGPLAEVTTVEEVINLDSPPDVKLGQGEDGEARFCRINSVGKTAVEHWTCIQYPTYRPTFIPVSMAGKLLSAVSPNPVLGGHVDATLPQYRLNTSDQEWLPRQDQYPVWMFFYGELSSSQGQACLLVGLH